MSVTTWTPKLVNVPITVTLSAYTAGDVVGGLLSCAVPELKGGGYIAWGRLTDDADQIEPFTLWCYYNTPSTIANDAAFAPTEADRLKLFTVLNIPAANYDQTGVDCSAFFSGKDKVTGDYHMFPALSTNGRMYFYLVAVDTPDYVAADDVTLDLCFMLA